MYGSTGSTFSQQRIKTTDNGYYPTNSGDGQNSFTVDDAYWWAIDDS